MSEAQDNSELATAAGQRCPVLHQVQSTIQLPSSSVPLSAAVPFSGRPFQPLSRPSAQPPVDSVSCCSPYPVISAAVFYLSLGVVTRIGHVSQMMALKRIYKELLDLSPSLLSAQQGQWGKTCSTGRLL